MHLNTPFNLLIVGMTGCGKTHYLLKLIETEYKKHFENIFFICPTFVNNKTYQKWKYLNDEYVFAIPCDHDEIERYLREVKRYVEKTNSLIVLGDCASSQAVKNRTSEIVRLGFSARHDDISTIVLTQQMTSIAKGYRDKVSGVVSFYNSNRKLKFQIGVLEKEVPGIYHTDPIPITKFEVDLGMVFFCPYCSFPDDHFNVPLENFRDHLKTESHVKEFLQVSPFASGGEGNALENLLRFSLLSTVKVLKPQNGLRTFFYLGWFSSLQNLLGDVVLHQHAVLYDNVSVCDPKNVAH